VLNDADAAVLAEIRSRTEDALRAAIGDVHDVAIVDAPNQVNVGDSLIWEGELAYLKRLGYRIRYVSDLTGYRGEDLRRAMPRGVVLIHGGGNFGDLWEGHQKHREAVVAELVDYPIVQLPQSVYFAHEDRAAVANKILGAHPDLRVLLRDHESMERARTQLPDVTRAFCPDMALGFDPIWEGAAAPPTDEILMIARTDKESSSGLGSLEKTWLAPFAVHVTDWGSHAKMPRAWRVARLTAKVQQKLVSARRKLGVPVPSLPQAVVQRVIIYINATNAKTAVALYRRARVVVVDRLHAHVLAVLLGIDHVLLDNSYRKLGAVYDDYTGQFGTASYCTDVNEARIRVRALVEA